MKRVLVLAITVLSACSSTSSTSGSASTQAFTKPADVGAAMQTAGLCSDYADDPGLDDLGAEFETGRGHCTVSGEKAGIVFYKDQGARDNVAALAASIGCSFKVGGQPARTSFDDAQGDIWTVSASTETTAKAIAAALGVEHKHIAC